jgi:L-serine/L-threonine ammonia-lyase
MKPVFYINSPLVPALLNGEDEKVKNHIFFKLDNLQPSGSFKDRGISHMINFLVKEGPVSRLVCSSGGNAGHAVATAGLKLNIPVDVYVPTTTKSMMVAKLKSKGANVTVVGSNWNEADAVAQKVVQEIVGAKYIPPFDDYRIWEGNSTIVDELASAGIVPDEIIVSVGGGGLLCGIQRGVLRHNWQHCTKVYAAETAGAASFAKAHLAGKPDPLPAITSIASSLGALAVTSACLNSGVTTIPYTVTDADAVAACRRFADDFNMLVEPACGAALSYAYFPHLRPPVASGATSKNAAASTANGDGDGDALAVSQDASTAAERPRIVVVVVCGGSVVNLELLSKWCSDFGLESIYK